MKYGRKSQSGKEYANSKCEGRRGKEEEWGFKQRPGFEALEHLAWFEYLEHSIPQILFSPLISKIFLDFFPRGFIPAFYSSMDTEPTSRCSVMFISHFCYYRCIYIGLENHHVEVESSVRISGGRDLE